jgi:hypothetical protein
MLKKHWLAALALLFATVYSMGQVQLTNIPTIYINTVGGAAVSSKTVWVPGFLTVVGGDSSDVVKNDTIEIRGRGNSTWNNMPKKPYRIKFSNKRHLLGMKDDAKDWVLLANYADKTLIRNAIAFDLGQFVGMSFTPGVRFADVYLNNAYLGNYMVTDQIEAGKNRVDIERLDTSDVTEPTLSGGYLFERDGFNTGESVYFFTTKSVPFSIKDPDPEIIRPEQLAYLKSFVQNHEDVLLGANWLDTALGYRAILDTASFLRWYIVSELTGNIDCFWSTSMYKRRNDPKLYYGPLWDYDIAFNNDKRKYDISKVRMLSTAFGANGDNKVWILQMAKDPWFKLGVNAMWKTILAKNVKGHIQSYIDSLVTVLDASVKKNYERWPILNTLVYNEWYKYPTYQEYVNVLKDYVNTRVDFLTTSFETDASGVVQTTPTFKLENYYYTISNKASLTLINPANQAVADSTRAVLDTEVAFRQSQQWKIVAMTDGSYQIVNRYTNKALRSNGLNRTARLFASNPADIRQHWRFTPMEMGNGAYRIVNVSTGNVLENKDGSNSAGTLVNENPAAATETTNQAWLLAKAEALPVGLNDVTPDLNVQVGPNPVSDRLFVRVGTICPDGRLVVFDLRGKRILSRAMNEIETTLPVDDLAEGVYFLRFTAGQQCRTLKFIVKH